jgi:hypothetical protein
MRYALIGLTALLLSGAVKAEDHDSPRRCKAKVDRCIALCLRQNPLNVCRTYCKREFVCKLG